MTWHWRYESQSGDPLEPPTGDQQFPSQSEAETWLGETWRQLRDGGVTAVRLFEADREVYGPMSLLDP